VHPATFARLDAALSGEPTAMITLVHRLASGVLGEQWEYDSYRRVVICVHDGRGFEVPVCRDLEDHRRVGSYIINRISEDKWRLVPSVCFKRKGQWDSRACPFPKENEDDPDEQGVAEFIHLTHAPALTNAELEAL